MIKLIKKTNKVWVHQPSDGSDFIFSKFYCKTVGEKFRVVEFGGSILKEYDINQVIVVNIGGVEETFANAELLMKRLEALNYVGFFRDGQVTAADLISTDPSNGLIIGTDGNLYSTDSNNDKLISIGTITNVANTLKVPAGASGTIDNVIYTTPIETSIPITLTAPGLFRKDILVLTKFSTIISISGDETAGPIVVAPPTPIDTLFITQFDVNDTSIGDLTDPILGTQFVEKIDFLGYANPTLSGANQEIQIRPNGVSSYSFSNPLLTSLKGCNFNLFTGNINDKIPYLGKDYYFFNNKNTPLTLKHDASGGDVYFLFIDTLDVVIPPYGKIHLKLYGGAMDWVGKSWSEGTKQNKVITFSLSDLGVATFAEVTDLMVANYITSLGIVEEPNYDYFYKLNDAIYNFDVTANWDLTLNNLGSLRPVTDEASFVQFLTDGKSGGGAYNEFNDIIVTNFSLESGRLRCDLSANSSDHLALGSLEVKKVNKIGNITNVNTLYLNENILVDFNVKNTLPTNLSGLILGYNSIIKFIPTSSLPTSLMLIDFQSNQMTLSSYTEMEAWANAQPAFTNPCEVFFRYNIDSVTGTPLEALLISKNCIIYA